MSNSAKIAATDLQSKLRIATRQGELAVEPRVVNGSTKLFVRNAARASLPASHLGFPVRRAA
jgi:hypothetical protein